MKDNNRKIVVFVVALGIIIILMQPNLLGYFFILTIAAFAITGTLYFLKHM